MDTSTEFTGSWTSLQFSKFDIVIPLNAHPNTEWADGSFTPTGYFMGESGDCFYIVRPCRDKVLKVWDISVYEIKASHTKACRAIWVTIQVPFRPNAIAVDVQQDLVAIVQSECDSFGTLHTFRLSTREKVGIPFVWETPLEFRTVVGKIEIKGDVIGLWTRQGVSFIESQDDSRQSRIQLRFFHVPTWSMIEVPTDGYEIWGLQFLDDQRFLLSLTTKVRQPGLREKLKHRLRVMSLKISPEFKVNPDPRLNYFINLPTLKTEAVQRVLLVRSISPTESAQSTSKSVQDRSDHRLIGLRYQVKDFGSPKDIIVLVNYRELLTRRENALFLKMKPKEVAGAHFALSGRRLVWSSGTSAAGIIHLRDYDSGIANECVRRLQGGTQTFFNPRNRAWQTTMSPLSSNPSKGHKGVHTETVPLSGIRGIFITQDKLVSVRDCRLSVEDPRDEPVTLHVYTF